MLYFATFSRFTTVTSVRFFKAAGGGVEPPLSVPETDVLPLDDPAI